MEGPSTVACERAGRTNTLPHKMLARVKSKAGKREEKDCRCMKNSLHYAAKPCHGGSGKPWAWTTLNEHFVLGHGPPRFAAAAVLAAAVAKQELDARRHTLNQAGELPNGRNHSVVHHVGRLFNPV